METSLWKLSAGFGPGFLETGWLALRPSVSNTARMLLLEHVDDLATIAASSQALVGQAEHEVNDLLRGTVAASCILGLSAMVAAGSRRGTHASRRA